MRALGGVVQARHYDTVAYADLCGEGCDLCGPTNLEFRINFAEYPGCNCRNRRDLEIRSYV
jgi:hypothetical protein